MIRLTITLMDKETSKAYHRDTLTFLEDIKDALKYIRSLQAKLETKYTKVRYTITVK